MGELNVPSWRAKLYLALDRLRTLIYYLLISQIDGPMHSHAITDRLGLTVGLPTIPPMRQGKGIDGGACQNDV
jgi:hypothetical protein